MTTTVTVEENNISVNLSDGVSPSSAQLALLQALATLSGLANFNGAGAASAILIKLNGTTAPTVNDDSGDGYGVLSLWVDTTNDNVYVCTDAALGEANWEQINGAGGGAVWGAITGTLANQTDLQTALTDLSTNVNTAINDLETHIETTTSVHGIADTSALLDTSDIGSSVQGYSAKTAAIAALTWAANSIILLTGTATASVQALAAHVVTFLQSASAADARTAIGAGTGNGDVTAASVNTFTRGQVIDGTVDEIQLLVQGHSTQTNRLQEWQNSAAATRSYIGNDGSWQIGPSVTVGGATGSTGQLNFFNSSVGARRGGASELVFYAGLGGADQMTIKSNQVGIGTSSPQGRFHSYDTAGSFMHVYKSGVVGSAVSVIANGTGDVTLGLSGLYTISDGAGGFDGGVIDPTTPGNNFNLFDDGGTNTCQLQVAADGSVTVIRTAGSRTYAVNLNLNWQ